MFESRTRTSKLLFHGYEEGEGSAGIAINARKGYEKKMQLRSGEWKMKDKNEITNRKGGGWWEEGAVVGYFETDLRSVGYFLVGQTQG